MPVWREQTGKVAFIRGMNASLERTNKESGIHKRDECQFGAKEQGKWHSLVLFQSK